MSEPVPPGFWPCPTCGALTRFPRRAYLGAGETTATCPNGHTFPVTTTVTPRAD